jgi:hypothetical protein
MAYSCASDEHGKALIFLTHEHQNKDSLTMIFSTIHILDTQHEAVRVNHPESDGAMA